MPKSRPKTGEKRSVRQPLKIDRLPVEVHEAILFLKNTLGKTWMEIEHLSSLTFHKQWARGKGGFVDWDSLDTDVLELFPALRLPHTNLHRWYDIRVEQVTAETLARSAQARAIAEGFAKSVVDGENEAVINAARDQIMSILAEDATPKGRLAAAKGLIVLAEVMQGARSNDIKERRVAVDERKLKALEAREELLRRKLESETEKLAKKHKNGDLKVADLDRLRERVFGLPATESHAA